MSERISRLLVLILLAALLGPGQAVAAGGVTSSIGADGEVYTLKTGTYGDLFPGWTAADEDNAVLALEIAGSDRRPERLLVPGTESQDVEDSASMVFEDGSGALYILWQTKINFIHSSLNLISFEDGTWSPVIEIWGSPFGWKTSPQLAVTRDRFVTTSDDETERSWARTVVHVIWAEEDQYGPHILYSPIVLIDGVFTGASPVYGLAELAGLRDGTSEGSVAPILAGAPRIEDGRNDQSVVVALADSATGRMVTLDLEILPGEIGHLADRLRHQIIGIGRELFSGDRMAIADKLRHQIIGIGHSMDLHPALTTYAANVVTDEIVAADGSERIDRIADRLRHQIIGIGARMTGRGVDRTLAKTGYGILELDATDGVASGMTPGLIRISTASTRPAPPTDGMSAPISLHISRSGEDLIVAWSEEDRVMYRESQNDGWSEVIEIPIGPAGVSSAEQAQDMLRLRAESRRVDH